MPEPTTLLRLKIVLRLPSATCVDKERHVRQSWLSSGIALARYGHLLVHCEASSAAVLTASRPYCVVGGFTAAWDLLAASRAK